MKLENSEFSKDCLLKISEPFGNFYIFNTFIVSEITEGVHFDWEKAQSLIEKVHTFFGSSDSKINYISNRINSYSVNAQDWLKFYKERHTVARVAIVAYEEKGLLSIQIEKIFTKSTYQTFNSLEDAIDWVSSK
ncbi:hypothetical protein [Rasiella sp. SM2506]|uniref:hypothetical protein n=1 Tax=Rasiella sp. SM2506 TaxID=3423914 RepID=UPI003D7AF51D